MGDPILFSQRDEFDERNLLLQLALGLLSASRRLDRLLERCAPPFGGTDAAAPDEPLVSFVLGLIAFRGRIERHAEAAAVDGVEPATPDVRSLPVGLLR